MQRGVALVTGSSSGIGLRTCVALVARGFRVYASMRALERGEALRAALQAAGFGLERVTFVALDVGDGEQSQAVVEQILDADGAVDVLVNNAGEMVTGFCEDVDEAALRRQFETNFFGLVRLTRALLPAMRERRQGKVINLSSAAGRHAIPGHGAYCASKFALEGWSEALRYEMIAYNVFVCLVEPGMVPTEIFGRNRSDATQTNAKAQASAHGKLWQALQADTARMQERLGDWADPDDVAQVIAKLALARRPRLRHPVGVDGWLGALSHSLAVETWWEQRLIQLFQR